MFILDKFYKQNYHICMDSYLIAGAIIVGSLMIVFAINRHTDMEFPHGPNCDCRYHFEKRKKEMPNY